MFEVLVALFLVSIIFVIKFIIGEIIFSWKMEKAKKKLIKAVKDYKVGRISGDKLNEAMLEASKYPWKVENLIRSVN